MSKPFKLSPCVPNENQVLNAVRSYLRLDHRVAWCERFNVGAVKIIGEPGKKDRFVRFAFSGCPDLLGMLVDGRLLAIEIKRPGGRLRPKQLEFLQTVSTHHGVAIVANCVEDVILALREAHPP